MSMSKETNKETKCLPAEIEHYCRSAYPYFENHLAEVCPGGDVEADWDTFRHNVYSCLFLDSQLHSKEKPRLVLMKTMRR